MLIIMCSPKLSLFWLAGMLCLFLNYAGHSQMKGCMETEKQALLKLKHGFIDDDDILSSWKAEVDCCQWKGVSCNNLTGHVTKLNIGDVRGNIDSSLCDLRHLTHLNLHDIYFQGKDIPKCIGSLTLLRELIISNSGFVGTIPHEWQNLTNLQTLDLSWNYDLVPKSLHWISHLTSLRYLHLSGVNLSRTIDWQTSLSSILPSLLELHLDACSLPQLHTKPFFHLNSSTSLKILNLASNNLDSSILSWVSNISKVLEYLDLEGNSLQYIAPDVFASATCLEHLFLQDNELESSMVNSISNLCQLKELHLSFNKLSTPLNEWIPQLGCAQNSIGVLGLTGNSFDSGPFPDISKFSSLKSLYLGNINLFGTISQSFIGHLPPLVELDLSHNNLSGRLPEFVGLSSLESLCLSNNKFDEIPRSFGHLPHLSTLDLSYNNFRGKLPEFVGLSSLKSLDLSHNKFDKISGSFGHLPHLSYLDLSSNNFNGRLPEFVGLPFFGHLSRLSDLDLSHNNLSGRLPEFVGLSSLESLCLSNNKFDEIPRSFGHLPHLSTLDLSYNNFRGKLPEFVGLSSLKSLDLSHNKFDKISGSFGHLPHLSYLDLSSNNFNGRLPEFVGLPFFGHLSRLSDLDLSYNNFSGRLPEFVGLPLLQRLRLSHNKFDEIPSSFGQLSSLVELDLSSNKLNGVINETYLSTLSGLKVLDVSDNSISFNFSSNSKPTFQLVKLYASSCIVGPNFPLWLKYQVELVHLEFSDGGISDLVPQWLWLSPTLDYLNLSHNKIHGELPKESAISILDLSFNNFSGLISYFPYALMLSNNKLSGPISSICAMSSFSLRYLDLSNNLLSGNLPDCWGQFPYLSVLNLASNNFTGRIPNSIGDLEWIRSIHLNNNGFFGELPNLMNLSHLELIDFGQNHLNGNLPTWIGNHLTSLIVLRLRDNKFQGSIPISLCNMQLLQVLDISHNNLTGIIPHCLNNLSVLSNVTFPRDTISYYFNDDYTRSDFIPPKIDNAMLAWKGNDIEYNKNLGYMASIDLSCNQLGGEIPSSIVTLVELASLNLSRNNLSGFIPSNMGHMKMLESLDLSSNFLSGEIPTSFSALSFLSYLNLSFNNLSGEIPQTTQLQTFDASRYEGNQGLCGPPLPQCSTHATLDQPLPQDKGDKLISFGFYVSLILGFILGFWGVCGSLIAKRSWRQAYFQFFSDINDWMYVQVVLLWAKIKRRFQD